MEPIRTLISRRPTPALVVALVALFMALGVAQMLLARRGLERPWTKYVFALADVALLTYGLLAPNPLDPTPIPPPLVLRGDGRVEEVPTSGTLIGAVPHTVVRPATVELAPGELCLLYSDGLTEARGGASGHEHYGERRLRDALSSCQGMGGEVTVERIRQLVSDWVHGGTRDDIAMLAVRAPARTPLRLRGGGARTASPFALDARPAARRARPRLRLLSRKRPPRASSARTMIRAIMIHLRTMKRIARSTAKTCDAPAIQASWRPASD
jgi:hypothetical protein